MRSVCRPEANSRVNNFVPMTLTLGVVVKSWACAGRNGAIHSRFQGHRHALTCCNCSLCMLEHNLAHKVHLLAGRRLLCHCETHQNCHGDVLIELFSRTQIVLFLSLRVHLCDGDVPLSSSVDGIVQEMGSDKRKFSRSPSQPWWQVVNRRQTDAGIGVLILFAGLRRPNSIKDWLIRLSAHYKVAFKIEDFDILNGPEHDLVDDLVARKVLHMIDEQAFQAIFMSPPCSTFTCLRSRPLRGITGKDRYGWQHLTKDELEAVKCETACSSFTARCAQRASELGVPWLVELPAEHPGKSHMLQLDEWSLPLSASIDRVYLDQCHFGSIDKKPTILVGTLPVARLSGRLLKNTVDVLKGTKALPPGGYSAELCEQLAHKNLLAAVNQRTDMLRSACSKFGVHTSRPGIAHLQCERVSSDNPCKVLLTPRVCGAQDLECLGGLRSCRRVRLRMPVSCARGLMIRRALENVLTKIPGLESRCLRALGSDMDEAGPTAQDLATARAALADLLPGAGPAPPWNDHFPSPVDHVLLAALRSWISDPDDQPEKWLRFGAPAGLASPAFDPCDLFVDEDVFTNYAGVDQDKVAQVEVLDLHRRGLLEAFDSIEEVQNYLGQKPLLSKVGVLTKLVGDKVKKRVIVDSHRSGVSDSTTKAERSVLPRVLDAVNDFMVQPRSATRDASTDFVVLDFTSAFFIIPLAWAERRFFVIRLRGKFFVFKVCAQGAAASPLVWARTAALVSRLTQYMFLETELAIEVFVDDPCLTVTGSLAQRNNSIAIVILFWRTLGFPLQFKKGQKGPTVKWIGSVLRSTDGGIGGKHQSRNLA